MVRSSSKAAAGILALIVTGWASAATTFVDPQGAGGSERCLIGVNGLCQGGTYGGAVSIIHALEMDLGGSLVRVDDGLDQIWQAIGNTNGTLVGRARYAADTLELGYDKGAGYVGVLNNTPSGQLLVSQLGMFTGAQQDNYPDSIQAVGGWTTLQQLTPGTLFAFVLSDLSTNDRWTSNNSGAGVGASGYGNSGAPHDDHMVTYKLVSDANPHYIIAWEDRPFGSSDLDYNDFVIEVKYLAPVPLPAALPLLVSGLIGFAGLARSRSRRAAQGLPELAAR
jgi:hypothetical protein